jgi:hypothetical protein
MAAETVKALAVVAVAPSETMRFAIPPEENVVSPPMVRVVRPPLMFTV